MIRLQTAASKSANTKRSVFIIFANQLFYIFIIRLKKTLLFNRRATTLILITAKL